MSTSLKDAVESILTAGPEEGQTEEPTQEPAEEPTQEPQGEEEPEEEEYDEDDSDESDDSDHDDEDDDDDDEYDDDADDDADQDETEYHTVKVDGKDEQVTLDDLKQGYSGQQFIQKGMKENAEARKQLEQAGQALQAQMQQVTQLHQQLSQQGLVAEPKLPSATDFENDPIGAMEAQMKYNEQKVQYDEQQAKLQVLQQQRAQVQQAQIDNYRREQAAKLVEKMPEIKDQDTLVKFQNRINKGGVEHYGFEANEIANMFDHRAYLVIDDALKYRELMAGKDKAVKKTKKARKMVKPGAKKAPQKVAKKRQDQQRAKFKKTGRMQDAVDLILT